MIFWHTTSAVQVRTAGLTLTDLSRAHVIRVLGLLQHSPVPQRRAAWGEETDPATRAVSDYVEGTLRGEQEAVQGETHHPMVPSLLVDHDGTGWVLEHQADRPDEVEADDASFEVVTGRRHRFVARSGVPVRLLYEDQAPIPGATVHVVDHDGNEQTERTSQAGWIVAGESTEAGAMVRVTLLECPEGYAEPA